MAAASYQDKQSRKTILAATAAGLFESRSDGAGWAPVLLPTIDRSVSSLALLKKKDKTVLYAGTVGGGVVQSVDGRTWTKLPGPEEWLEVWDLTLMPSSSPGLIVATMNKGAWLYRRLDP